MEVYLLAFVMAYSKGCFQNPKVKLCFQDSLFRNVKFSFQNDLLQKSNFPFQNMLFQKLKHI